MQIEVKKKKKGGVKTKEPIKKRELLAIWKKDFPMSLPS